MIRSIARALSLADRGLEFLERAAIVLLFLVSVSVLILDIVLRSTVGVSFAWAPELTRYAIVWLVFIGASVGARSGAHISIDLFSEVLSERHARWLLQGAAAISVLAWATWSDPRRTSATARARSCCMVFSQASTLSWFSDRRRPGSVSDAYRMFTRPSPRPYPATRPRRVLAPPGIP